MATRNLRIICVTNINVFYVIEKKKIYCLWVYGEMSNICQVHDITKL